jgi:hypothetical protein
MSASAAASEIWTSGERLQHLPDEVQANRSIAASIPFQLPTDAATFAKCGQGRA